MAKGADSAGKWGGEALGEESALRGLFPQMGDGDVGKG